MAAVTTSRRPSPLQRRVLIVLAALDAKRPGPVATRDIERVLEQGGDAPVYGPNPDWNRSGTASFRICVAENTQRI
ncbi:hypothetical protein CK508_026655 (plasmid) [Klebsiella pneumoniae]|nr:hypothetical protein CK508_026655 [Klebsiella pneumoniae]